MRKRTRNFDISIDKYNDNRSKLMSLLRDDVRKRKNINFLINPTVYSDYDVIAVGQLKALKKFCKDYRGCHLIKRSIWGFPLLIIDTFDDIKEAVKLIKEISTKVVK